MSVGKACFDKDKKCGGDVSLTEGQQAHLEWEVRQSIPVTRCIYDWRLRLARHKFSSKTFRLSLWQSTLIEDSSRWSSGHDQHVIIPDTYSSPYLSRGTKAGILILNPKKNVAEFHLEVVKSPSSCVADISTSEERYGAAGRAGDIQGTSTVVHKRARSVLRLNQHRLALPYGLDWKWIGRMNCVQLLRFEWKSSHD